MNLRLRVYKPVEKIERGPNGDRTITMYERLGDDGNEVVIRGYNRDPEFFQGLLVNPGYAMTRDVPKQFFDLWMKQNADSDLVKNGLIFSHPQPASVVSFAREHESNLSGLEPLQPTPPGNPYEKPPRPTDPRLKSLRMSPTTMSRE